MNDHALIETTKASLDLAVVDVRDASAAGLALMRERVENQKKMLAIAISLTSPGQWTVFAGKGKDGVYRESIYPTGGAADTILRRAFGLSWGEKVVTVHQSPDGPEAVCVAWLMQGDRPVEQFEGRRKLGGFIKTEADMRKGAVENMKSVAVRDLLGLRFRTPAELREMGLDVGKLERRAEFQDHAKDESGVPVIEWGKKRGTPLSALADRELDWYIEAAKKAIADPDKAQWAGKERGRLAQYEAERASRLGKDAVVAPPAREPGPASHPDDMPVWWERQRSPGEE